jgi:hypothetical protein
MFNDASGDDSSVSGGVGNTASGYDSSVTGGYQNEASGTVSSVSGGYQNYAGNVCSGGTNPGARCVDDGDCTGGGTCEINSYQSVGGGRDNEASGDYSSVSGGNNRTAAGGYDWAAGALWEDN